MASPQKLLAGVAGVVIILVAVKLAIPHKIEKAQPTEVAAGNASTTIHTRKCRPIIVAKKSTSISIDRVQNHIDQFPSWNDRGDLLYRSRVPGSEVYKYELLTGGKVVKSGTLAENEGLKLKKDGALSIYKKDPTPRRMPESGSRSSYPLGPPPYNDAKFIDLERDDRSTWQLKYSFTKQGTVTSLELVPATSNENTHATELYQTTNALDILEVSQDESLWIQETSPISSKRDVSDLFVLKDGRKQMIAMPTGYRYVDRVSTAGSVVVGTFGYFRSAEPIRSFRKQKGGWQELPLPEGAVFSFVQKVLTNGLILGFVTDENFGRMRQVVWDGDEVSILNDQSAWPKTGTYAKVQDANRHGDIFVYSDQQGSAYSNNAYSMQISRKKP